MVAGTKDPVDPDEDDISAVALDRHEGQYAEPAHGQRGLENHRVKKWKVNLIHKKFP